MTFPAFPVQEWNELRGWLEKPSRLGEEEELCNGLFKTYSS